MMYKAMNDLAPQYVQSIFSQHHFAYNLRNFVGRLTLSKPSTNREKRSFSYSGAILWNNLPKSLKNFALRWAFYAKYQEGSRFIRFPHGNHVKQL